MKKQNFDEIKSFIEERENIDIFEEDLDLNLNQQNLIQEEVENIEEP
jgi:hypothetical protein